MLSRYDHVIAALRDPGVGTGQHDREAIARISDRTGGGFEALLNLTANYPVNTADGAEHQKRRAAFAAVFRRSQSEMRVSIETEIDTVPADLPAQGQIDAVTQICDPLALKQVALLLDQNPTVVSRIFQDFRAPFRRDSATRSLEDLRHMDVVARRMRDAFDDISNDIQRGGSGRGADVGAIMFLTTIIVEGLAASIGKARAHLSQSLALQDRLGLHPDQIAGFVRESLRFGTPVAIVQRQVGTRPVTLAGHVFEPDTRLLLDLGAANRDPARFPDPDVFDPDRPAQPTLAFATGPHTCMGIAFSRQILEEMVARVLSRYRLVATSSRIELAPCRNVLAPLSLPVMLEAAQGAA